MAFPRKHTQYSCKQTIDILINESKDDLDDFSNNFADQISTTLTESSSSGFVYQNLNSFSRLIFERIVSKFNTFKSKFYKCSKHRYFQILQ